MIALVLAAGRGTRMGGPKALLPWPERDSSRTLLEAHVTAAVRAGCDRVVCVVRAPVADALAARVPASALLLVSTEDDALGPAGSIAAFVRRASPLPPDEVIAVAPVDLAPRAWRALELLARGLVAAPDALAARPAYGPRRGHPVLLRAPALSAYAPGASPRPLRDVLAALGDRAICVPVDEVAVTADIDTPDDLAAWREP